MSSNGIKNLFSRTSFYWRRLRAFVGKGWIVNKTSIVTDLPNEYCANPIFIIGTHRSGTSLLRRIVDSHANIACPPESFFLQHYGEIAVKPDVLVGLDNLGFHGENARRGLAISAAYFHETYKTVRGKQRWADKTPQYVFCLDSLLWLFGRDAQFVFIQRNPLDVAYSIWKRGWRFGDYSADALENTCMYVSDAARKQLDFISRNGEICHVIKYEELVENPIEVLQGLCAYLNEPWDPQMLSFSDIQHDFGTEDPIVRGTRGFVKSVDNWRGWDKQEFATAYRILEHSMFMLGYRI